MQEIQLTIHSNTFILPLRVMQCQWSSKVTVEQVWGCPPPQMERKWKSENPLDDF